MAYNFKAYEEAIWFVVVTAAIQVFTVLVDFDPETIIDWKSWAIALGGGVVRAVAAAIIAKRVTA